MITMKIPETLATELYRAALDATLATSEAQAAEAIEAWPEIYLSWPPIPDAMVLEDLYMGHLYRVNVGTCLYMS